MMKLEGQLIKFNLGVSEVAGHNVGEDNNGGGNLTNDQPNSAAIYSSEVTVKMDVTTHTSGSSAITTRNITKYPWDQAYIPGNLVAVHCSENFIAYAIKAPKTLSGMVRIICRCSGVRGLVKNIPGLVKDIAFAYLSSKILLGFVDQYGTVYVYEVTEEDDSLRTVLIIEAKRNSNEEVSDYQRLLWCPYLPDDEEVQESDDDNLAYLLVSSNGPSAKIWHIATMLQENGGSEEAIGQDSDKILCGRHYMMEKHSAPIVDAAFSPDGTALATAGLDGFVKFFQIYMTDGEAPPRCLHQWNPHNGQPLSCLFFLDNHRNPPSPEVQFWKEAVTGACNNTEIKVWSCETWKCNQTLKFEPTPELSLIFPQFSLKAAIDPTAKYLVLSDIYRRVSYVLLLSQEVTTSSTGAETIPKTGAARIYSLTELPIQFPIISMCIINAEWKRYKTWEHDEHLADASLDEYEKDKPDHNMDVVEGLVIKTVLINTQSLQDATIRFQPSLPPYSSNSIFSQTLTNESSQDESIILRDGLTDLSITGNLSSSMDLLKQTTISKPESIASLIHSFNTKMTPIPVPPPPSAARVTSPTIASLDLDGVAPNLISPVNTSSKTNEPLTMNLLTPESFSSPGRVDESSPAKKDSNLVELEKMSQRTPTPSDELKSAAMSLRLHSSQSSSRRSKTPEVVPNILDSVISGSRISPTMNCLPPPPPKEASPIIGNEDAPLATSELCANSGSQSLNSTEAHVVPTVGLPSSSTSSPSLEVQQILHSHNNKSDDDEQPCQDQYAQPSLLDLPNTSSQENLSSSFPPLSLPLPVSKILTSVSSVSVTSKAEMTHSLQALMSMSGSTAPDKPDLAKKATSLMSMIAPLKPFSCSEIEAEMSSRKPIAQNGAAQEKGQPYTDSKDLKNSLVSLKHKQNDTKGPKEGHLELDLLNGESRIMSCSSKFQSLDKSKYECISNLSAFRISNINLNDRIGVSEQIPNFKYEQCKDLSPWLRGTSFKGTNKEIELLREMIYESNLEHEQRLQVLLDQTTKLVGQFEKSLKANQQMTKQVEEVQKSQKKLQEQLPSMITSNMKPLIDSVIRQEVRNALTPALSKCLDPMRIQINNELRNVVGSSEAIIIETLTKILYSRNFVDNVSTSVSSSLSAGVQNACRDSYSKIVLPGLNAVTTQVFSQLNETFTRGTKEYLHHVETESQNTRLACNESINKAARNLDASVATLSNHSTSLMETLQKNNAQQTNLSDTLGDRMKPIIRTEVSRAIQEHYSSLEAQAPHRSQTPAPSAHTPTNPKLAQQQVQYLISQSQFNAAFKQALSASDLSLVVFVCERINPQQLFSHSPCPLSQDVLLSLVNQLSHDLTTFTDLKTKYLEESVMNLDTTHPVTREHMKTVLQGLQRNLTNHVGHHPNHKKLKMLLLAVNHLAASTE